MQVEARTTELQTADEQLRQGIDERLWVDAVLRDSEETARRLARENAAMAEIGRIVGSSPDIQDVYERFAAEVRRLIPFSRIGANLVDFTRRTYELSYVRGLDVPERDAGAVHPLEGSFTNHVAESQAAMIVRMESERHIPATLPGLVASFQAGVRSSIGAPVTSGDKAAGVLILDAIEPDAFEQHHVELAQRIADQIAGAIVNSQLYAARQRAETEIRRLVRQNDLILNSAGEGICGVDLHGATTFANPAAARMVGWTVDELIGKSQHDVVHHSRPDGAPYPSEHCPIHATLADGQVHHVANEVFWRNDNRNFPVEYVSTPIRDENGELVGAVVTFRDITERIEVDRLKDEFVSTVSHELRTPVTSIKGFLDLIIEDDSPGFSDEHRTFLEAAARNTQRLERLVGSLLDISRLEAGRLQINVMSFDFRDVVDLTLDDMRADIDGKSLKVSVTGAAEPVVVWADRNRTIQILANLMSNAIKYTLPRKSIKIEIGALKIEDGLLRVDVVDEGSGIPPDAVDRVFEKFYRVEGSGMGSATGTGIGLAISKALVELQGGMIWAESELGKGSTFSFTLPRLPESVA
ncbi:MAG: PAS domain-containing protein [SAR202 cluster bacterium]|nr:hypothetical protein [Chloroflexota bacterium]MQG70284.1 PAS domain-containing protein [SAR202 cluster bacterium]